MSMLSSLIPYRKEHSLSEAVLTIYLLQEIIKPERFENLILEGGKFYELFDEFKTSNIGEIKVDVDSPTPKASFNEIGVSGFTFRKFFNGKPEWVINYNATPNNVGYISIHCLNYSRWNSFLNQVEVFLNIIADFDSNIHVKAYGLNNIDQFSWIGTGFPDIKSLFDTNNQYLPSSIFSCKDVWNSSLTHVIKKQEEDNPVEYIEKLNIYSKRIVNGNINIGIIHNTIKESETINSLKDLMSKDIDTFKEIVNWSHHQNKTILKKLLTKEVQNLINLV